MIMWPIMTQHIGSLAMPKNLKDWNDEHCSQCAKYFEDCECPIIGVDHAMGTDETIITFFNGPEAKIAVAFLRRLPLQKLQTKDFSLALFKDAEMSLAAQELEKMDQAAWEDFLVNNVY